MDSISLSPEVGLAASIPSRSPVDERIISCGDLRRLLIRVWVLREVRSISWASNLGNEGYWETFLPKFEPVEVLEPTMIFDIIGTVTEASVALRDVCNKQMLHETLCIPKNKI